MHPANEWWRYNVMSSLIGRAYAQNDPCIYIYIYEIWIELGTHKWHHIAHITPLGVYCEYYKTSNISCTLVGINMVANSDVVGASAASAAPTTSSFLIYPLASIYSIKTTARRDEKHLSFGAAYIRDLAVSLLQNTDHVVTDCCISTRSDINRVCYPGSHWWGYIAGTLSFLWSHCSLENKLPVDEIYGYLTFIWVTVISQNENAPVWWSQRWSPGHDDRSRCIFPKPCAVGFTWPRSWGSHSASGLLLLHHPVWATLVWSYHHLRPLLICTNSL